MEQTDQFNETENPSYWASIGIAALIFGIVVFALQTAVGYMQISGSMGMGISFGSSLVVCLIGAFGGMMAVWHYANEYDITFKLGKGALIGFLTGVALILLSIILGKLWLLFDPDFAQQIMELSYENMEEMGMTDEQIEAARQQQSGANTLMWQLIIGIPVYGITNLLTGMIGVPLFAKEEKDY